MRVNQSNKSADLHQLKSKTNMVQKRKKTLPAIGWREWVGLPELGVATIKAKVDTGARSSSLHAFNLRRFKRDGVAWVRFQVHPTQHKRTTTLDVEAQVLEYRTVRSSSGKASLRPVIVTQIEMLGVTWPIEVTLASRDTMGFRMLLGREAFRDRFLVDAGNSYYGGKPTRKQKKNPLTNTAVSPDKVKKE